MQVPKTVVQQSVPKVTENFIQMQELLISLLQDKYPRELNNLMQALNTWQVEIKHQMALQIRRCCEVGDCGVCWKCDLPNEPVFMDDNSVDSLFVADSGLYMLNFII